METNKDKKASGEPEMLQVAELYLSTGETLAGYAYEATARQQQMNMLAQQVTSNSVRDIYAAFAPKP